MAGLNRFLMILIAILAIGAAVLSFLLFQRRTEFRDRATMLSENAVSMVKSLDKESATNVARKVNFTPADPDLGTKESGTLSLVDFHNDVIEGGSAFRTNLKAAAQLAADINEQRNYLAQMLDDVAFALKIDTGELSIEDLKNASEVALYTDASKKVKALAEASEKRTEAMINTLVACSNTIEHSLEDTMFRSREPQMDDSGNVVLGSFKHDAQLSEFSDAVAAVNQRCNAYGDTIAGAIELVNEHSWETDSDRVKNKLSYDRALATINNDFSAINEELIRSKERKIMVEKLNVDLNETKTKLAETKEILAEEQKNLADKAAEIAELTKKLIAIGGGGEGGIDRDKPLNPNLKGHIVQVNEEWNYVILDLGEADVYENLPLLVSRGEEYVGKVHITKVAKNICVAQIDRNMTKGEVQAGDVVFLPKGF